MILSIIIFPLQIFHTSCQSPAKEKDQVQLQLSNSDRRWMEKFFNDLLFDGLNGTIIYTIFGTKPLSSKTLVEATEEEWIKGTEHLMKDYAPKEQVEILNDLEDFLENYDLSDNWQRWILWTKKQNNRAILFVKRPSRSEKFFTLYVLNSKEALWILHKYYNYFRDVWGKDFSPEKVIDDFESPQSSFWQMILNDHFLSGLLHGYGERNSYFFALRMSEKIDYEGKSSCDFDMANADASSLNKLRIPPFKSYESGVQEDPIIQKFKRDRKMIQQRLKNKNIVDEVLKKVFQ